jgi:hypothetical protein
MKHAIEMGGSAMLYIPSFIKHGDFVSLILFLQNKECRLKTDKPNWFAAPA